MLFSLLRSCLLLLPIALAVSSADAQLPFPLQQYGNGGFAGGSYVPSFHTEGQFPTIGNKNFQLMSRNLRGGASGLLWLSSGKAQLSLFGMTLWVDVSAGFGLLSQANGTAGLAGAGTAMHSLPVPNISSLTGAQVYLQGFYLDTVSPISFVHTQGLHLTLSQAMPTAATVLYERAAYQAHFLGASASQADVLGKAIWQAHAVSGFAYVKIQQFAVGGQTHWMIIVKDQKTGMEFTLIPGGSFQMGDLNKQGLSDEVPIRWVHFEPFLLARTEVTQASWQGVMNTKPWFGQTNAGPTANCAANYLSWNDATAFCAKAGYRLPTEAEWEYACRAGTNTSYYYGNNASSLGNYAWWWANAYNTSLKYPHPVGLKLPNAFGLHDIHGNLWEWCQDITHNDYKGAPTNGSAWTSGTLTKRIMRGGGWHSSTYVTRCANRLCFLPTKADLYLGFRPAKSLR